MGPMNELFHEAMVGSEPVHRVGRSSAAIGRTSTRTGSAWRCSTRRIAATITQAEAKLLVRILLSAAADTTVMTLATAMRAFCVFPDQYQELRQDPSLARSAFEESLRWDSPSRMAGRITTRDVEIEDYVIPAGDALRPDVRRGQPRPAQVGRPGSLRHPPRRSRSASAGATACTPASAARSRCSKPTRCSARCIKHIERFEPAGEPEPWMTTIGHGPAQLPVRIHAAAGS